MNTSKKRSRIPLSTLAIPFGLSGLAEIWTEAGRDLGWVPSIGYALWVVAAIAWVWLITAHVVRGVKGEESLIDQLKHPAQGPIGALAAVVGMLLGATIYHVFPVVGIVLVIASITVSATFAGWLLSFWLSGTVQVDSVHGGYFLPTVASGLIAATTAAEVGLKPLAIGAFAVGIFFWIVILIVLLARFATRPQLPDALIPTLAIIVAPPAVAGTAWFVIEGVHRSSIEYGLAALAVVMVLMQVFLIPVYRKLRFSLGFWSFTFSFAAVGVYGIQWLALLRPFGWQVLAVAILIGITVLIGTIGIKSIILVLAPRFHRAVVSTGELVGELAHVPSSTHNPRLHATQHQQSKVASHS
jgi:tellurite resistance protein